MRRSVERLEVRPIGRGPMQELRLGEVPADRVAELRRAVRTEREPELQRSERTRVLEGDVGRVQLVLLVREVALFVGERLGERVRLPDEGHAAGLGDVEPLVRVDTHGVGALHARESVGHDRCRRAARTPRRRGARCRAPRRCRRSARSGRSRRSAWSRPSRPRPRASRRRRRPGRSSRPGGPDASGARRRSGRRGAGRSRSRAVPPLG